MKISSAFFFLFAFAALFSFSACQDDDDVALDDPDFLNYDGDNFTAPTFGDQGTNTFAAFFPAGEVQQFVGRQLQGVQFWLQTIPDATSVVVYETGSNDRGPGNELYRIDLTARINNTGFYTHTLPAGSNIEIPAEGLWLAIETTIPAARQQTIGCDDGANYSPNGDRYRPASSNVWTSFNEVTGTEAINWNIRGIIAPVE